MKKLNLILFAFLAFSITSCNSEPVNEESKSIKKEDSSDVKDESNNSNTPQTTTNNVEENAVADNDKNLEVDEVNQTIETSLINTDTSESIAIVPNTPVEEIDTYNFHEYKKLNILLNKYVSSSGKVNYSGIKSDLKSLNAILKEFESNYPASGWSKNQKLSYWINAYNIYTIKLIVDNYPTSSITKITAKPWDKKFIKLGGKTISLNHIENEMIRKNYNEPRIHFALNCASKSCPVLLNAAYTPNNLQAKLTSQTKRFLRDMSKNKFGDKEIQISKLFEWYAADFTKNGTVIDFINKYRTEQLVSPTIKYMDYSWDLNN